MLPVNVQDAIRTRNTPDFSGTMSSVDSGNDKYTEMSKCRNSVVDFGWSRHFNLEVAPVPSFLSGQEHGTIGTQRPSRHFTGFGDSLLLYEGLGLE